MFSGVSDIELAVIITIGVVCAIAIFWKSSESNESNK